MKILIISAEVWRGDVSDGNVLSNIFTGIDAEFAQIYCNAGEPDNNLCKLYYQINDNMIIKHFLKREDVGKIIKYNNYPAYSKYIHNDADTTDLRKNKALKLLKNNSAQAVREILWNKSKWKSDELKGFILDFNPDIIFAPCYGNHFLLAMTRYAAEITGKPVVSYIYDDHYSLKQFSLSPVYWGNRLLVRRNLRKTFPYYSLVYTMTAEQLKECKEAFDCNIKILKKSSDFEKKPSEFLKKNTPIRLVFAGNTYVGRWKTLVKIKEAIEEINKDEIKFELNIYTGDRLTLKQRKKLDDGINSKVHGLVTQEQLKKIYNNADIAIHVEDFGIKNRLATRISFSTKIIDLLGSSCAIMAVAWNQHSGYAYLKENDIAICIDDVTKIKKNLLEILENTPKLSKYAEKAWDYGYDNHQKHKISKEIREDFEKIYLKDDKNEDFTNQFC